MSNKAKVIYIMGALHNGSTFLGVTLGNHPEIEFVGELSILPRRGWLDDYVCACGQPITVCQYWGDVRDLWTSMVNDKIETLVELERLYDRQRRLPHVAWQKYAADENFALYGRYMKALFEAVSQVSGKEIIVDSSKRYARALALSMVEEIDLRLIHLIRDARGVAYSWSKPTRPEQLSPLRASFRWNTVVTISDLVARRVGRDRVLQLRYEDFIARPAEVLGQIGRFADVNLAPVAELIEGDKGLDVSHVGVGNGFLQSGKKVKLRSKDDWPQKMPPADQQIVWRMSGWKMRRLGYEKQIHGDD